jgi:hypothetical protein
MQQLYAAKQLRANYLYMFQQMHLFFISMGPRIVSYRGGTYDQQDATNSLYLLLEMLYMFRAIIAHHQELGTVCAAVRCIRCEILSSVGYIPGMVFRWYSPVCSGVRIWSLGEAMY